MSTTIKPELGCWQPANVTQANELSLACRVERGACPHVSLPTHLHVRIQVACIQTRKNVAAEALIFVKIIIRRDLSTCPHLGEGGEIQEGCRSRGL